MGFCRESAAPLLPTADPPATGQVGGVYGDDDDEQRGWRSAAQRCLCVSGNMCVCVCLCVIYYSTNRITDSLTKQMAVLNPFNPPWLCWCTQAVKRHHMGGKNMLATCSHIDSMMNFTLFLFSLFEHLVDCDTRLNVTLQ